MNVLGNLFAVQRRLEIHVFLVVLAPYQLVCVCVCVCACCVCVCTCVSACACVSVRVCGGVREQNSIIYIDMHAYCKSGVVVWSGWRLQV